MNNMQIYNDYLMHHGIKGMKWGVRRSETTKSTKRQISSDRKRKMMYAAKVISANAAVGVGAYMFMKYAPNKIYKFMLRHNSKTYDDLFDNFEIEYVKKR